MAAEKSLETQLVAWCEAHGFLAPKLVLPGERGWPDRAVLLPEGRVQWIELKAPNGRVSPQQREWARRLAKVGHEVAICDTFRDCIEIIHEAARLSDRE